MLTVICQPFLKMTRKIHQKSAKSVEKMPLLGPADAQNRKVPPTTYCVSRKSSDSEILIGTILSYSIQMFTARENLRGLSSASRPWLAGSVITRATIHVSQRTCHHRNPTRGA